MRANLKDETGAVFGDLTVIELATEKPSRWNYALWVVECSAGHRFTVAGTKLRERQRIGRPNECPQCLAEKGINRRSESGLRRQRSTCSVCQSPDHVITACPNRPRAVHKICGVCHGLAHRRQSSGCPGCKGAYVIERREPVERYADARQNRRELA